jgi:acyl-CoA thioester hydrolase
MNKLPESRIRVRFKDCDPLGHLYNTRYIEYMLESREDHILDHYDLNLENYATLEGRAWVVVEHQISYLKEARRNEYVRIRSSMIHFGPTLIVNEYQMWDDALMILKSILWTKFLHIDLKVKKTTPHDPSMMSRLESIILHIDQNEFEERVSYLKSLDHAPQRI